MHFELKYHSNMKCLPSSLISLNSTSFVNLFAFTYDLRLEQQFVVSTNILQFFVVFVKLTNLKLYNLILIDP